MDLYDTCASGDVLVTKMLLFTSDVNEVHPVHGFTALQVACKKGFAWIVEVLLMDPRLDPNFREKIFFASALHLACAENHPSVVRLLVQDPRVDKNRLDVHGWTPFLTAYKHGFQEIIDILDGNPADFAASVLVKAVKAEDLELVDKLLLLEDTDVNSKDTDGDKSSALAVACIQEDLPVVRSLLRHPRIDPNLPNVMGETPLHEMARTEHHQAYQMVLNHSRTNPCAFDNQRRTPLAVACARGNLAVVYSHLATRKGTEYQAKSTSDMSGPFPQAVINNRLQIARTLLEVGLADYNNVVCVLDNMPEGTVISGEMKAFLDEYHADVTAAFRGFCRFVARGNTSWIRPPK